MFTIERFCLKDALLEAHGSRRSMLRDLAIALDVLAPSPGPPESMREARQKGAAASSEALWEDPGASV